MQAGIYKHYKGKYYLVLGVAQHSETQEEVVVYVSLYTGEGPRMFVRPRKMFEENGEINGKKQKRFEYIGTEIE
ncbi:MAG TPA: DUF1653 domain-containing protein [Patescibacteria group bacterium]|nr:DUF1653 domain-containing protein [Patescibacteria group bacterium]